MKKISVHLTEQQIVTIHAIAKATGLKFAEVLRRMLDKALEEQQK